MPTRYVRLLFAAAILLAETCAPCGAWAAGAPGEAPTGAPAPATRPAPATAPAATTRPAPTTAKAPATTQAMNAAGKLFQNYYGKLVDAVEKTPEEDDDVAVAQQMLVHACDTATSDSLRLVLAKAVLNLLTPLTDPSAGPLAKQAAEMIDAIQPMSELERICFETQMAEKRLARAVAGRKSATERGALAMALVRAHMAFAEYAQTHPGHYAEAEEALKAIPQLVFRHRLTGLRDGMAAVEKLQRWFKSRQQAIQVGKLRLAAAQKKGDAKLIQVAHLDLAKVYVEFDGNLGAAAPHFIAGDHPAKDALAAAAAFQADPNQFQAQAAVPAARALLAIIPTLSDIGKERVGRCALDLIRRYLEGSPMGADSAEARLLAFQVEKAMGYTPERKLLERLAEAYGGLNCRLKTIDAQRVRVGYDFSAGKQLSDFTNPQGEWKIGNGALGVKAEEVVVATLNKLRFRCDRPLQFSFMAMGASHLGGWLVFYSPDPAARPAVWRCAYSAISLRRGTRISAIYPPAPAEYVPCSPPRLVATHRYRIDIRWNGMSTLTWLVNGRAVGSATVPFPPDTKYTTVACGLETSNSQTYFGEVMMEGELYADPSQAAGPPKPPTSAPATSRPAKLGPPQRKPKTPVGPEPATQPATPAAPSTQPATSQPTKPPPL